MPLGKGLRRSLPGWPLMGMSCAASSAYEIEDVMVRACSHSIPADILPSVSILSWPRCHAPPEAPVETASGQVELKCL